ncbi:ribonuclease HII [candidate division WOR-3 bacterium]|nr:ribonuclease HII [candidate division WOR-3 bacterium]
MNRDLEFWSRGIQLLCGIDEAGRGPLAGPVIAASVILPPWTSIDGVKDSKLLSPLQREKAFDKILKNSIAIGVGIVEPIIIDRTNILLATYEAMKRAILDMEIFPEFLLIDGFKIPRLPIPQRGIVHGDRVSLSIGAASIIAKVVRDRIMEMYDLIFPQYDFCNNKGYGTKKHIEAIRRYGPCEIHRKTFRPISELQG